MLVEFRVKNFKSLRDEQVLSLVAAKDKSLQETNTMTSGNKGAPLLLKSAVIYGLNAGGKSNLIKAFQYMRDIVAQAGPAMPLNKLFAVPSFQLNEKSKQLPTEFEVTFILEGVRYQYGFALTAQRITSEYLFVYKTAKPQQWFKRDHDKCEFGPSLKGKKNWWESALQPNRLLLSVAALNMSEQLQPVYTWLIDKLIFDRKVKSTSRQVG